LQIGVDVGYGFVKAVSSEGGRVSFPSVVAPLFGERRLELPGVAGAEPAYEVEVGVGSDRPQRFAVGDYALHCEGAVRAWRLDGQAAHENTKVLLLAACALLGCGAGTELGLGIPLELYVGDRAAEWEGAFSGVSARVRVGSGPAREVSFSRVLVFPQAMGALFAEAFRRDGRGPELLRKDVGVVDVGYRTTDLLLMRSLPGVALSRPDPGRSTTIDRGVSWVYEQVWLAVQSRLKRPVDFLLVEQGFLHRGGLLRLGEAVFDLEGEAEQYRERLAREIGDEVRRYWSAYLDRLDAILVAGGGGQYLYGHLSDALPGCHLAKDAAFSNAAGYLAMLMR